jgi:APA family basic amino acid/polyamine antiporter
MAAASSIWGRLSRVKPLDAILTEADQPEYQLKRALGPFQLTMVGIGAIVGAGIFATIGTAAAGDANRPGSGPALMLSFVVTAIVCSFTALCYAEFASMVPIAGSAYTYSYATLGEGLAWVIGWDLIIEYAVGNIGVAISWANYFKTLLQGFNIHVPDWLSTDYRTAALNPEILSHAPHLFGYPIVFNFLAVTIVAALTVLLIWGVRESARFNAVMVSIKILVLLFFVGIGTFWIQPANWQPFAPNGWAGISAGAAVVFFAYIGFDAVSTVAEETREPQRNLPIGIIASLIICTLLYILVSAVFTGLMSYETLTSKLVTEKAEPLTMALEHANPNKGANWPVYFVAFGSVVAHTAVLLVFQLGQTRIFFSMSRDGLLPPVFRKLHPRFRTPYLSTILIGVIVAAFATVANIDEMVDLTNIGTLFAFILVCTGIIVLRVKDPGRARPFRVPSGWGWALGLYAALCAAVLFIPGLPFSEMAKVITLGAGAVIFALGRNIIFPLLGVISCLYLIYYLPETSWLRFAAWLNFGFVVYVGYGAVHSRLTGRQLSDQPAEHDAMTAYTGAWLAVLGAAMLVVTRAFILWLEGWKSHEQEVGRARVQAILAGMARPAPWLELSELLWFLLIPLALNAFVLCPIVIRRALKARREGAADPSSKIGTSLMIASGLTAATVVYLLCVWAYNRHSVE